MSLLLVRSGMKQTQLLDQFWVAKSSIYRMCVYTRVLKICACVFMTENKVGRQLYPNFTCQAPQWIYWTHPVRLLLTSLFLWLHTKSHFVCAEDPGLVPHGRSSQPVTPVPLALMPSSALQGYLQSCAAHKLMQACTRTHKWKENLQCNKDIF